MVAVERAMERAVAVHVQGPYPDFRDDRPCRRYVAHLDGRQHVFWLVPEYTGLAGNWALQFDDLDIDWGDTYPFSSAGVAYEEAISILTAGIDDLLADEGQDDAASPDSGIPWDSFASPARFRYWFFNQCIPGLLALNAQRGFLSLHQIAGVYRDIKDDQELVSQFITALNEATVRITRSVAWSRVRRESPPIAEAEEVFSALLHRTPYPQDVLRYLRVHHVPMSADAVHFVMSAFELHQLTAEDEARLLRRLVRARQDGRSAREVDPEAWQALFNDSLWIVCRMAGKHSGQGVDFEDLVQEGCLGVMRGLDRYELGRAPRMQNYISTWIFQSMTRAVADQSSVVRMPVHFYDQVVRTLKRVIAEHEEAIGVTPTASWCADRTGLELSRVELAMRYINGLASINPLYPREERWMTPLVGQEQEDIFDQVYRVEIQEAVAETLEALPPRERDILYLRFGIGDDRDRTLEEVGQIVGLTRERVRQLEARALKELRCPSLSRKLSEFWLPAESDEPRPLSERRQRSDTDGRAASLPEPVPEYPTHPAQEFTLVGRGAVTPGKTTVGELVETWGPPGSESQCGLGRMLDYNITTRHGDLVRAYTVGEKLFFLLIVVRNGSRWRAYGDLRPALGCPDYTLTATGSAGRWYVFASKGVAVNADLAINRTYAIVHCHPMNPADFRQHIARELTNLDDRSY